MQRHDRFQARILRIAHVRLRFRRWRRVAIIRVAREPVFEPQRVDVSVKFGASVTMRRTSAGIVTCRPTSSVTVARAEACLGWACADSAVGAAREAAP